MAQRKGSEESDMDKVLSRMLSMPPEPRKPKATKRKPKTKAEPKPKQPKKKPA